MRTGLITTRRVVISLILAGCVALMGWGFTQVRPTKPPIIYQDPAIRSLTPAQGDRALRQSFIEVTLAPDFALAYDTAPGFTISGIAVPQDQLQFVPGLNQYFFYPGPGKELTELPVAPRVCVGLRIKRTLDQSDLGHRFSWCFFTH